MDNCFRTDLRQPFCCADFKVKHDSSGLRNGMDTQWQALFKGGQDGSNGGGCGSGCLHCH